MLRLTARTAQVHTRARPGPFRSGLAASICLGRALPLFFASSPRTPLRVLCIVALDTIHLLRHSQPLSPRRRQALATFLDFQACTNALWDRKPLCTAEYDALRQELETAGLGVWVASYLERLGELESRRPSPGTLQGFEGVRSYREAVVRLSLATLAAIALNAERLEDAMRASDCDSDIAALFRMAMQCQIIDDVVDYRKDLLGGLPSFLTASASLPRALASTAQAAHAYSVSGRSAADILFPLHVALGLISLVTKLIVRFAPGETASENLATKSFATKNTKNTKG